VRLKQSSIEKEDMKGVSGSGRLPFCLKHLPFKDIF
jgi:hypothetical protein